MDMETIRPVNHVRAAVENMTHWAHARHIVGDENEAAYRGLLKLYHFRDDEARNEIMQKLIGRVFYPEIPMVRANDAWLKPDFTPLPDKVVDGLLLQLPAVHHAVKMPKGGYKAAMAPVTYNVLRADYDLAERGYPNLTALRGVDIAEHARHPDDSRIFVRVPARPFSIGSPAPTMTSGSRSGWKPVSRRSTFAL
jgi:hypothetical protein